VSVGVLPGGYWDAAGGLHRDFELAALTGREEELLVQASGLKTASMVTQVLTRCLRRLGTFRPVPAEVVRCLLVADRQHLLLRLRQETFGAIVRANLICPWRDCGERMSMEFTIDDLPVEESPDPAPLYTMTLSTQATANSGNRDREITFRLPNGGDQEELSHELADNEAHALNRLLARCIQRVGSAAQPDEEYVSALSPLARAEIEQRMVQVAPKVEQTMEVSCVACGRLIMAPLDIHGFFFGDLRADASLLYQEVHYLAFHYHWSEREIMAMTREKRRTYIEVLADAIEGLNRDS
jgi:hypothetical protein